MKNSSLIAPACVVLISLCTASAQAVEPSAGPHLQADPAPAAAADKATGLGTHWLGLGCHPVPAVLRSHLDLPEDQGLLVQYVVPDSPAAEAGIKLHDVIITAAGKSLGTIGDMIEAVRAAGAKEMTLELIRGGERQKIKVTPAKRPDQGSLKQPLPVPGDLDWDVVKDWFERMPGAGKYRPRGFQFIGPGMILPRDGAALPPLPGNMSVTITKEGDAPAKIVVKQNDQTWEATEDKLDELPERICSHVGRMLGHIPPGAPAEDEALKLPPRGSVVPPAPGFGPTADRLQGRLEKRLEQMDRRIDQLRESIDQMWEKRPRRKASEKKQDEPREKKSDRPKPDKV